MAHGSWSGSLSRPERHGACHWGCRKHKARLVTRNLAFVATLMNSGVEFVAVDNPHANKLTFHIPAAVANHERESDAECFGKSYHLDRRRRPAPSKPM